jgi:hypothetical protein
VAEEKPEIFEAHIDESLASRASDMLPEHVVDQYNNPRFHHQISEERLDSNGWLSFLDTQRKQEAPPAAMSKRLNIT